MNIAYVSKRRTANVGDLFCDVPRYIAFLGDAQLFDNDDPWEQAEADAWIFGGGGLLGHSWIERMNDFAYSAKAKGKILVAWSIGMNQHGATSRVWPKFLDRFSLVGLRSYDNPWLWVPCVSCLHSAFSEPEHEAQHDLVVYSHADVPVPTLDPELPQHTNNSESLEEVVAFLRSGRTILTSSYHGAYWGLLLGKKVQLAALWSNKFAGLLSPWVHQENGVLSATEDYLLLCRRTNERFLASVRKLLNS